MRYFAMGLLVFWLWGCAAAGPESRPPQWQCPAEADEAVNRGDWDTALRLHRAVVDRWPKNCLAIYHLGYIMGQQGDRSAEVALYERALACGNDRDDRLLFNLGMAYGELGRPEAAVKAFERAVALDGANADNHYGLGLMLREQQRLDQAAAAFYRALAADHRHWEARMALCRLLLDQGRLSAARAHLDVLADGLPDSDQVRQLQRLYQRRRAVLDDGP